MGDRDVLNQSTYQQGASPYSDPALASGSGDAQGKEGDKDGPAPGVRGTRLLALFSIICVVEFIIWRLVEVDAIEDPRCETFEDDDSAEEVCDKVVNVYRAAAAALVPLALQLVLSLLFGAYFYDKLFLGKLALAGGLGALLFLVPLGPVYGGMVWIVRIGGAVFVLLQALVLLDLAYALNEKATHTSSAQRILNQGAENLGILDAMKSPALLCMLVFGVVMLVGFVAGMALLYTYAGDEDCENNISIITISFCATVGIVAYQLFLSSNGSVTSSSVIMLYVLVITISAISNNPRDDCNPFTGGGGVVGAVLGLALSAAVLLYTTFITTRKMREVAAAGGVLSSGIGRVVGGRSATGNLMNKDGKAGRSMFFFSTLVFILMLLYAAAVLTNWGVFSGGSDSRITAGTTSMYLQAAAAWIALALYLVKLLLPNLRVLPRSIWEFA